MVPGTILCRYAWAAVHFCLQTYENSTYSHLRLESCGEGNSGKLHSSLVSMAQVHHHLCTLAGLSPGHNDGDGLVVVVRERWRRVEEQEGELSRWSSRSVYYRRLEEPGECLLYVSYLNVYMSHLNVYVLSKCFYVCAQNPSSFTNRLT